MEKVGILLLSFIPLFKCFLIGGSSYNNRNKFLMSGTLNMSVLEKPLRMLSSHAFDCTYLIWQFLWSYVDVSTQLLEL